MRTVKDVNCILMQAHSVRPTLGYSPLLCVDGEAAKK
uniref:Uncharacterized protein n=1 Tax=Anguilla anguilla TaxID=7936 RepID=A0A0E9RI01_ANGAN